MFADLQFVVYLVVKPTASAISHTHTHTHTHTHGRTHTHTHARTHTHTHTQTQTQTQRQTDRQTHTHTHTHTHLMEFLSTHSARPLMITSFSPAVRLAGTNLRTSARSWYTTTEWIAHFFTSTSTLFCPERASCFSSDPLSGIVTTLHCYSTACPLKPWSGQTTHFLKAWQRPTSPTPICRVAIENDKQTPKITTSAIRHNLWPVVCAASTEPFLNNRDVWLIATGSVVVTVILVQMGTGASKSKVQPGKCFCNRVRQNLWLYRYVQLL